MMEVQLRGRMLRKQRARLERLDQQAGDEKTTGEAGADKGGSAGGGAAAAPQVSEEVGMEAPTPGETIGMPHDVFNEKYPDCHVDVGCWTGANKSINTPCKYRDDQSTPCPLKEEMGPIEVKMKGNETNGSYECVVCYHQRARTREIWLCNGRACQATRRKYAVESPDAASASPPPRHVPRRLPPPGASPAAADSEILNALQKQVTQISDVVHKMNQELTEVRRCISTAKRRRRQARWCSPILFDN